MDPTEQISIRHSEPCPPSSYHRVHSTPVAISRHHSMPSFGAYLVYHMVEYSVPCLCCTQIRFYSVVTLFLWFSTSQFSLSACNHWGNEATRRSYTCLLALNKPCPKCIRRRRCTSCCVAADPPKEMIEFWGMFVDIDISDTYETPLKDIESKRSGRASHKGNTSAKRLDGNNNNQCVWKVGCRLFANLPWILLVLVPSLSEPKYKVAL